MRIIKAMILLALIAIPISLCSAKITCSAVISDNMVLQRNTAVKFWGNANAGDKIIPSIFLWLPSVQMIGINNHF